MASKKPMPESATKWISKQYSATNSSSGRSGSLDGCEGGEGEPMHAGSGSAGGDDLGSNNAAPNVNVAGSISDASDAKARQSQ